MALIVTIIVLLILAGVSIATLAGNNGLISRTTIAKEATRAGEVKELVRLEAQANKIAEATNDTQKTRSVFIAELVADGKLTSAEAEEIQSAETPIITIGGIIIDFSILPNSMQAESGQVWTQDGTTVTDNNGVNLTVGTAVSGYEVDVEISGTTQTISNWYVLGAKDGRLLITTSTNPEIATLSGKEGYLRGVSILNSIATKYTNSEFSEGDARSIDVDDINRVTGYNADVAKMVYDMDEYFQWENEVTYTLKENSQNSGTWRVWSKGTKYPEATESEPDGLESRASSFEFWDEKEKKWIKLGDGDIPIYVSEPIKNTAYYYRPNTLTPSVLGAQQGLASDSLAYNLLFLNTNPWDESPNGPYWLGSTYVKVGHGQVDYGLRTVFMEYVEAAECTYRTNGKENSLNKGFRPVVSLKSSVKVTQEGAISK